MSSFDQSMSSINRNQRVFGSSENALIKASLQHHGYLKVGEVLHLQGPHISIDQLISAIRCLQRRHPFLRSRLRKSATDPDKYLMEEDNELKLRIRDIPRQRNEHRQFWCQEWRKREKDRPVIGEGLAEFWLLQDPDGDNVINAPREVVIICEHSICDGLSLSTVAHELLIALSDENNSLFENSLNWPMTMEDAIQETLSKVNSSAISRENSVKVIAKIPLTNVGLSLTDMAEYCSTKASYGSLSKEETQKLMEKCHQQSVTVTSVVGAAMLCTIYAMVSVESEQATHMALSIAADTRRRCIPPVPNHDLSYQVSGLKGFTIPIGDIPTTPEGMWQLSKMLAQHMKTSIEAGHMLTLGMIIGKFYEKNIGPINFEQMPTCGISNWGCLPFREQYEKWVLTGMTPLVNMIRFPTPVTLVQTVNGILTIGYVGATPILSSSMVKSLCTNTIDNLRRMIED